MTLQKMLNDKRQHINKDKHMKVLLAGYNLDADIINEMKEKSEWSKDNVTPETLSASYARISRDPRDISVLRKESRNEVAKARKSNSAIIFGLGHASVAEHAYFNFDIIGLSRLAVEYVQKFRLASFTEKSQRYITLEDDYIIPEEIKNTAMEESFKEIILLQNKTYHTLYQQLKEYLFHKHNDLIKKRSGARTVDGWAKEDARYIVSMSTESQFGMSVNARTLENMLRQFNSCHLAEIRELGKNIYNLVQKIAPSIIKYVETTDYDTKNPAELIGLVSKYKDIHSPKKENKQHIKLIDYTKNPDEMICSIIVAHLNNLDYETAHQTVMTMNLNEKKSIIKTALSHRELYDVVSRYFEYTDFTFETTISSSNYAQLKRHRISSQLPGRYDPKLKVTVPPNIKTIGKEELFLDIIKKTDEYYAQLSKTHPLQAEYILTNAHRRKIIIKMNMREIYHFISMRLDEHAQWDIRATARELVEIMKEIAPLSSMMLCGKSNFADKKNNIYG